MLSVEAVSKSYGSHPALEDVSVDAGAGEIVGLLGPNGAGKTTLVSIIAGLRRPDAGRVLVDGIDVSRTPRRARALIGLAPQETGIYPSVRVRDNLQFFGGLAGLRGRGLQQAIDSTAAALMLDGLMDRRGSELSGGERRRLHTAIALVHRPKLILLDEPTTGADVQTRGALLALVRELAAEGSTVVYSTHYLHEIEELEARIVFMDHGRVVARGAVADLVRRFGTSALELTFTHDVPAAACLVGAIVSGSSVRIPHDDPANLAAQLLPRLGTGVDDLCGIEIVRPSLESVFMTVAGRRYDHAESAA